MNVIQNLGNSKRYVHIRPSAQNGQIGQVLMNGVHIINVIKAVFHNITNAIQTRNCLLPDSKNNEHKN